MLRCVVRTSQPVAQLAVRLCQVFADGTSAQVTRGFLNLTHRHGHGPDAVANMPVDTPCAVTVLLNAVAHTIPAGCRIRVAVSPMYVVTAGGAANCVERAHGGQVATETHQSLVTWCRYWPMAWPSPLPVSLHVYCASATRDGTAAGPAAATRPQWLVGFPTVLQLPVRDHKHSAAIAADAALPAFEEPVGPPPLRTSTVIEGSLSR